MKIGNNTPQISAGISVGFSQNISLPGSGAIGNISSNFSFGLDSSLFSGDIKDPYAQASNLLSSKGGDLSSLGLGNVPGFNTLFANPASQFGGQVSDENMQQMMQLLVEMFKMLQQVMASNTGTGSAGSYGVPGGSSPISGSGGSSPVSESSGTGAASSAPLTGDDQAKAQFIDEYLGQKGSPAAGQGAGAMMVKYGKEYNVDPFILLAIAGQETQWGKTGIGVNGMLGVGAYDSDPNNATRNPTFSGVENQIKKGAQTFAKLRDKAGCSPSASVAEQTSAVNKAGWATDQNWHVGVTKIYNQIAGAAS